MTTPPSHLLSSIAEVAEQSGSDLAFSRMLDGGAQGGAVLLTDGDDVAVLKLQPEPWKADRLLAAAPAVARAAADDWPVAHWRRTGRLADGTAWLLQDFVAGHPVQVLDEPTVRMIIAANATQAGLGHPDAFDDSAQLAAVLHGDHPWRDAVAQHSAAGASLVAHGRRLLDRLGAVPLPTGDVVHGDYSSANLMITDDGSITFVDCETVGRGTRVRDLADLYRQGHVHPGSPASALDLLREAGSAVAGPALFASCVVATSYNNLAWWVDNMSVAEFELACGRLVALFDQLTPLR